MLNLWVTVEAKLINRYMFSFNDPVKFFSFYIAVFFLIIVARYFLAAGVFYYYYYVKHLERFKPKRLSKRDFRKGQLKKEIKWSLISSVIFAVAGALVFYLYNKDLTAIYNGFSLNDIWYIPLSLILVLLIHETYYYWIHRWMHKPRIYRKVHKVHHDSLTPTPWTAFSFHPWEAVLEAIILPVILLIIPMHLYAVLFYLIFMTLSSVINHLDIEIYPESFQKNKIGRYFIGATHHHYHHSEFNTNYGLYFTFWDRWMETESEKMEY